MCRNKLRTNLSRIFCPLNSLNLNNFYLVQKEKKSRQKDYVTSVQAFAYTRFYFFDIRNSLTTLYYYRASMQSCRLCILKKIFLEMD